jgi:hypothetical protein
LQLAGVSISRKGVHKPKLIFKIQSQPWKVFWQKSRTSHSEADNQTALFPDLTYFKRTSPSHCITSNKDHGLQRELPTTDIITDAQSRRIPK